MSEIVAAQVPRLGDKVIVRHRTQQIGKKPIELAMSKDVEIRTVCGIYMERDKIRDQAGETWKVVPNAAGNMETAQWMTVE